MHKEGIISLIEQQGILPLFYHDDPEICKGVVDALYGAGVRLIEFTNRGTNALANFKEMQSLKDTRWQGLQFGIGTVLNVKDAQAFIEAGAGFIICPGVIPAVAEIVNESGLLWIPGCLTATEIIIAKDNGATLIKIFPGTLAGPSYISAVREIFPDLLFMPTGGVEVNEANLSAWFKAGACAVGLGSKVISREALLNKDYEGIGERIHEAIQLVRTTRFGHTGA